MLRAENMIKFYTSEVTEVCGSDGSWVCPLWLLKKPRNQSHVPILLMKSSWKGKEEVDLVLTQSASTVTEGKEL